MFSSNRRVGVRIHFLRDELSSLGGLLYPQVLHINVFRFAQSSAVDEAHRSCGILM